MHGAKTTEQGFVFHNLCYVYNQRVMPSRFKVIETTKYFSFKMKAELKKDILCFWVNTYQFSHTPHLLKFVAFICTLVR